MFCGLLLARLLTRETKMVRISRTKVKNQNVYQLYINDVVDFKRKDGTIGFLHFLVDFEDMWFVSYLSKPIIITLAYTM